MIKSIQLENWKSHYNSRFDFGRGTNVLVGLMGAGKSSVVEAICFALFGTFPAINSKRLSLNEVVMNKPQQMQKAKIKLEFDYAGKEYVVERELRIDGVSSAKLLHNGTLIAGPKTTDVTKKIEEILEVDYELFNRAVFSEQNQIDYFLRLTPLQRKEKFDDLLDIRRYERARGNTVTVTNRLKRLLADRSSWVEEQEKNIDEKAIMEMRRKIAEKEKAAMEIEKQVAASKTEYERLQLELQKLAKDEQKFKTLKEQGVALSAENQQLAKNISEIEKQVGKKNIKSLQEEQNRLETQISETKKSINDADKEISLKQKEINQLVQSVGAAEARVKEVEKINAQLMGADAHCPVCKNELGKESKELLLEQNRSEALQKRQEMEKMLAERKVLESKILETKKNTKENEENVEGMQRSVVEIKNLLESASKLEKSVVELQLLESKLKKNQKELKELDFNEVLLRKKDAERIEAKAKVGSLLKEAENSQELLGEFKSSLRGMEDRKKQVTELKQSISHLKGIIEKTTIFTNALKATQADLRKTLIETINIAMDDLWEKIYPYRDYTSAKIDVVGDSYEVMVRRRTGEWVRVEGILSGGERSAAAITMRVGISLVLAQNLSMLVLDEPTHNLDSDAVAILSNMMKEHLPQLVGQIFIITHDKQMESAASATLYILERDKAGDAPTKPVEERLLP